MIKLAEITEPKYQIQLPDGSIKEYDPWLTVEVMREKNIMPMQADEIRAVFGFPKQAEADGKFTPTPTMCAEIYADLQAYIESTSAVKKLTGLMQKSLKPSAV